MSSSRRQSRVIALQALYEVDCTGHSIPEVLSYRLKSESVPEDGRLFVYQLVNGVTLRKEKLDDLIQQFAPDWPIDQMAIIDRNILRIAIFEIAVSHTAPLRVAINEAVELAKAYGADTSPRFVNGVLGSVVENEEQLSAVFLNDADAIA
jgi:N utilization substance protein B